MNPWDDLGTFDPTLEKWKLKKVLELKRSVSTDNKPKKKYEIKERNYCTYNYLNVKHLNNFTDENFATSFSSVEEKEQMNSNTLLNILVRDQVRKEKKKYTNDYRISEQNRKRKLLLEEEKRKIEEEKEKHKEILNKLKEEYLLKREKELIRRQNDVRYLKFKKVAIQHHETYLLRTYFSNLKKSVEIRKIQIMFADQHHNKNIMIKYFLNLRFYSETKLHEKYQEAERIYAKNILKKYFSNLKKARDETLLKIELADTFYSHLQIRKYFDTWKIFSQDEKINLRSKMELAKAHFDRKLKEKALQSFRKWIFLRQERSKRQTLQGHLREVVRNVLPDFNSLSSEDEEVADEEEEAINSIWEAKISTFMC